MAIEKVSVTTSADRADQQRLEKLLGQTEARALHSTTELSNILSAIHVPDRRRRQQIIEHFAKSSDLDLRRYVVLLWKRLLNYGKVQAKICIFALRQIFRQTIGKSPILVLSQDMLCHLFPDLDDKNLVEFAGDFLLEYLGKMSIGVQRTTQTPPQPQDVISYEDAIKVMYFLIAESGEPSPAPLWSKKVLFSSNCALQQVIARLYLAWGANKTISGLDIAEVMIYWIANPNESLENKGDYYKVLASCTSSRRGAEDLGKVDYSLYSCIIQACKDFSPPSKDLQFVFQIVKLDLVFDCKNFLFEDSFPVQTGCAEDLLRLFFDSLNWRPIKSPAYLGLATPPVDAPAVFLAQTAIFRQLSTHSLRAESLCQSYIRGLLGKMNNDARHRLEALRLFFFLLTNCYEPIAMNGVAIRAFTNENIQGYLAALPIDRPEVKLFIDMITSILSDAAAGQLNQELLDKIWSHGEPLACHGPDAIVQNRVQGSNIGSRTGASQHFEPPPVHSPPTASKPPNFDPQLFYEQVDDSYATIPPASGRIVGLRNTKNTCYIVRFSPRANIFLIYMS